MATQPAFSPQAGAAGSFDLVAANADLKEYYGENKMASVVLKDRPFMAMLEKKQIKDAVGKYVPQPLIVAPPMGRSNTYTAAYYNQAPVNIQSFTLNRFQNFQVASLDDQASAAAMTGRGAFIDAMEAAIDPALDYLARNINSQLFRDGTGTIGQIASITSGGLITLTNTDDALQFEEGQVLLACAVSGGATYGAVTETAQAAAAISGGYIGTIQSIDYNAGTFTVYTTTSGTGAQPTGWVAGSFLRTYGDVPGATVGAGTVCPGLAAWMPTSAPASNDNFFGINRSLNSRLTGIRFNGTGQSIQDALIQASAQVNAQGGNVDVGIVNFTTYQALQKELSSNVRYVDHEVGVISFRGIELATGSGRVNIFADRDCQSKTGYLLTMKHWKLWGLGDVPHMKSDLNGNLFTATPGLNSFYVSLRAYYVLGCEAPVRNAVVQLSA